MPRRRLPAPSWLSWAGGRADLRARGFGHAAVAAAHGVALGEEAIDNNMALAQSFPPNNKTSMFQDLEAGRRLEIDYLSGAVVRLGREKGIETPIHRTVWVAIKPWVNGPPTT